MLAFLRQHNGSVPVGAAELRCAPVDDLPPLRSVGALVMSDRGVMYIRPASS